MAASSLCAPQDAARVGKDENDVVHGEKPWAEPELF
jgi:hypothetical protein